MATRRAYTDDFKRDIVSKIGTGRGDLTALAKTHDLDPSLLHGWRKKFGNGGATASKLAPSKTDPSKGSRISRSKPINGDTGPTPDDEILELVWEAAARMPIRKRFGLVAKAGQRLL